MRAHEFVEFLKRATPTKQELESYGLAGSEIDDIQSLFNAIPRSPSGTEQPDELIALITEFDCSSIEIGGIEFKSSPTPHRHGIVFGKYEADPLVIVIEGDIAMFDHANVGVDPIVIAANSESFLDALAKFVDILKSKVDWADRFDEAVEQCSQLANGKNSEEFFRTMLAFLG